MEIKPYKLFFSFSFLLRLILFYFFNREGTLRTHLEIWEAQATKEKRWRERKMQQGWAERGLAQAWRVQVGNAENTRKWEEPELSKGKLKYDLEHSIL